MAATSRASGGLVYALIARGTAVLAEHGVPGCPANAGATSQQILAQLSSSDTRVTYAQLSYVFSIRQENGMVFLCMAQGQQPQGRSVAFAFLEDIKERFFQQHSHHMASVPPYSLTSELGPVLAERMAHYSNAAEADALQKVKADLDHVRSIMLDNVDRVLERGERIDTLVSKADHLSFDAMNFRTEARRLRRTMQWRQIRYIIILCVGGTFLLYLLLALICGWGFGRC